MQSDSVGRDELLKYLTQNDKFITKPDKKIIETLLSYYKQGKTTNIPTSELPEVPLDQLASNSILKNYIKLQTSTFDLTNTTEFLHKFDSLPTPTVSCDSIETTFEHNINARNLLNRPTYKEKKSSKESRLIYDMLNRPTAMDRVRRKRLSAKKCHVRHFCEYCTRSDCPRANCEKVHFNKIINCYTEESLGDCSYLNTCFHTDTCKYLHYFVEKIDEDNFVRKKGIYRPPQWIKCDIRTFDLSIIGQFGVIMADPPWDIHMDLPYGTMTDDEIRNLPIMRLQSEGFIFLWVTGRAMELGRGLLKLWNYKRAGELIWLKTNQLHRVIRTGRTGHWLNHAKEHCLVGVKGNVGVTGGFDSDVIVSEVRETSRKPDEIYALIERISPGTRKLELFGRPHNTQINWLTLGDQIDGVRLWEPFLVDGYKNKYHK